MKHNKLGRTDLSVPHICLGTMTWGCQNTEEQAHEQMDYALDHGVNFFDTAELYAVPPHPDTWGLTEKYIGTWFKKTCARDKVILASKVTGPGLPWIRGGELLSRKAIETAIDASLQRLQTDYIDLYQIHWPNRPNYRHGNHGVDWSKNDYAGERDNIVEILETAADLIKAGKIRHLGLSNDTAWGVMTYLTAAERKGLPRVVSIQNEYSFFARWFDKDLGEIAVAEDVGLLAWGVLADGSVSGKYRDGQIPAGTRWAIDHRPPAIAKRRSTPILHAAVPEYIALAQKHGLDVCQMAIAWCLTRPFMTSVIIGATTMDQLKTNIAAHDVQLSNDVLQEIDALYRKYAFAF